MSIRIAECKPIIAKILTIIVAITFGFTQGLFFIQLFMFQGAEATRWTLALITMAFLALAGGALFGYNFPRFWVLAMLNAWFFLVLIMNDLPGQRFNLSLVLKYHIFWVPASISMAAGYLGARLKRAEKKHILAWIFFSGVASFLLLALPQLAISQ